MSTKFSLINRRTGEKYKSTESKYVVIYDSGMPAFVHTDKYWTGIYPVDMSVWKLEYSESFINKVMKHLKPKGE